MSEPRTVADGFGQGERIDTGLEYILKANYTLNYGLLIFCKDEILSSLRGKE